ncbi:hypothetical protein ES707_20038 [subsurface metagenome]
MEGLLSLMLWLVLRLNQKQYGGKLIDIMCPGFVLLTRWIGPELILTVLCL